MSRHRAAAGWSKRVPFIWQAMRFGLLSVLALDGVAQVSNPSFESNTTDGGTTYQPLYPGFTGLPGWTFSTSPSPVLIGTPDDSYAYKTPFGRWQLDLSGSDNVPGGWIETTLGGLTPGARYTLEFALGASVAFAVPAGPAAVRVTVAGNPAAEFTAPTDQIVEFQRKSLPFVAPANGPVALRFLNISPTGTGLVSVDDLRISALAVLPTVAMSLSADGTVTLEYSGRLESSTDLVEWTATPEVPSGTALPPVTGQRFFRAVSP